LHSSRPHGRGIYEERVIADNMVVMDPDELPPEESRQ
jgi:hypothetical protein